MPENGSINEGNNRNNRNTGMATGNRNRTFTNSSGLRSRRFLTPQRRRKTM